MTNIMFFFLQETLCKTRENGFRFKILQAANYEEKMITWCMTCHTFSKIKTVNTVIHLSNTY